MYGSEFPWVILLALLAFCILLKLIEDKMG